MYNLRYHVASLVAVFFALTVGLVLGSIVVERGTIDSQQAALVKSLQTDFVRMNAENKTLSAQVSANEEFENELVPRITQSSLTGQTILVLANAGRTDALSSVVGAIEDAGGRAAVAMLQGPGLLLDQAEVADAARTALGTAAEGDDLPRSVNASLSVEWADGGPSALTDALVSAQALRIDNLPSGAHVDGLVTLAAWDKKVDPITVGLSTAARQHGMAVVGAQPYTASTDVARAFADAGLDAVNDAGTPRGNYSLVMLLSGNASGFFGVGPSTDAPFPPLPEPTK